MIRFKLTNGNFMSGHNEVLCFCYEMQDILIHFIV